MLLSEVVDVLIQGSSLSIGLERGPSSKTWLSLFGKVWAILGSFGLISHIICCTLDSQNGHRILQLLVQVVKVAHVHLVKLIKLLF